VRQGRVGGVVGGFAGRRRPAAGRSPTKPPAGSLDISCEIATLTDGDPPVARTRNDSVTCAIDAPTARTPLGGSNLTMAALPTRPIVRPAEASLSSPRKPCPNGTICRRRFAPRGANRPGPCIGLSRTHYLNHATRGSHTLTWEMDEMSGILKGRLPLVTLIGTLLSLWRQLPIAELLDVPDLRDKDAARKWLLKVCEAAGILAEKTTLTTDDKVVAFLARTIADPVLFDPFHALIVRLLGADPDLPCTIEDMPTALAAEADAAGINPLTIIAIVTTVLDLLRGFGLIKRS